MSKYIWSEENRPTTIEDCILPARLKKSFEEHVASGNIPNMILTGSPGIGKTTVAQAMCKELNLPFLKLNSSKDRGIDMTRTKIPQYASTVPLQGGYKVIIMDEADGITPEAQDSLRGVMEEFPNNCRFIFTCNNPKRIIEALHSRCTLVDFRLQNDEKPEMAKQFFKLCGGLLGKNEITYDKQVLARVIKKYFPDFRRTLNELQAITKGGSLDVEAYKHLKEVRDFTGLVEAMKNKDFQSIRSWAVDNSDIETKVVYRKIYDELSKNMPEDSIPTAVIILARYQYQDAFVADSEMNLVACLTELMMDCSIGKS